MPKFRSFVLSVALFLSVSAPAVELCGSYDGKDRQGRHHVSYESDAVLIVPLTAALEERLNGLDRGARVCLLGTAVNVGVQVFFAHSTSAR